MLFVRWRPRCRSGSAVWYILGGTSEVLRMASSEVLEVLLAMLYTIGMVLRMLVIVAVLETLMLRRVMASMVVLVRMIAMLRWTIVCTVRLLVRWVLWLICWVALNSTIATMTIGLLLVNTLTPGLVLWMLTLVTYIVLISVSRQAWHTWWLLGRSTTTLSLPIRGA